MHFLLEPPLLLSDWLSAFIAAYFELYVTLLIGTMVPNVNRLLLQAISYLPLHNWSRKGWDGPPSPRLYVSFIV